MAEADPRPGWRLRQEEGTSKKSPCVCARRERERDWEDESRGALVFLLFDHHRHSDATRKTKHLRPPIECFWCTSVRGSSLRALRRLRDARERKRAGESEAALLL